MPTIEAMRERLRATAFDPELTPGAVNAVNTCLRIQGNEKVTVITDERSLEIAAGLDPASAHEPLPAHRVGRIGSE